MVQGFLNLLKWFAYATITLIICMVIVVPLAMGAEYLLDRTSVHPMMKNGVFWIIGLAGLFAGMGLGARLGFDPFSVPIGNVDRDAE